MSNTTSDRFEIHPQVLPYQTTAAISLIKRTSLSSYTNQFMKKRDTKISNKFHTEKNGNGTLWVMRTLLLQLRQQTYSTQ